MRLDVQLGRLHLANPMTVASGTFGYAREMAGLVEVARLGAILPKTITLEPRQGNPPPRTVETTGGLLNSIGLDNDGIHAFIERQLPYLASLGTKVIVSIAGRSAEEFVELAVRLESASRHRRLGVEPELSQCERRGGFRHESQAVRASGRFGAQVMRAADPGPS